MSASVSLFDLVKVTPSHAIGRYFEWEDKGLFGRKTKRYLLGLKLMNKQEARQLYPNRTVFLSDELYAIGFHGDLPPSIQKQFTSEELSRGYSEPSIEAEGFMRRIDDLLGRYQAWADSSGWEPV